MLMSYSLPVLNVYICDFFPKFYKNARANLGTATYGCSDLKLSALQIVKHDNLICTKKGNGK